LIHRLRGDLDWIAMKCLEKDRTRRYETANALAADLQRHLDHEPVEARPPSAGYKLRKFARRNRVALGVAGALAGVLVVATGVSVWQAVRATRAEGLANERLRQSEAITKFLTGVFRSPDPSRDGRTITVAETLDTAVKNLDRDLGNHPALRAQLQGTLGETYFALGLFREAIPLQEQARNYYLATFGPEHPDTLTAMYNLSRLYTYTDRGEEASELAREVLRLRRKVNGPEDPATPAVMLHLANLGAIETENLELREEALRLSRKVNGPEHPTTLMILENLANSYADAGRREEGLSAREELLRLRRKVLGPEHLHTLWAMNSLASSYANAGRQDEAFKLREEALRLSRKVNGPEYSHNLAMMSNLADAYAAAGRGDEALKLFEEVLTLSRKFRNPASLNLTLKLAALQVWFGKEGDYTATCRRMLQWAADQKGPDPADRAAKITNLRPSADPQMLQAALAFARRAVELGQTNSLLPWYQLGLGMAQYRNGHYPEADQVLTAAPRLAEAGLDKASQMYIGVTSGFYRAMSLFRQGKATEARQLFAETEATMKPLPADDKNPLANGANHDDLILWLACKEARALLIPPQTLAP
jgi:tetratricopeptide (TPR) repeat protein